ncbi:MAG: polysaccharide biosynthesis/export family protein [Gammaproteobacteria bacterium]
MKKLFQATVFKALWAFSLAVVAGSWSARAEEGGAPYVIQPGDLLTVSVWNEQQMLRDVLVRPDGGISYPLAGDLQAGGHSAAQVSAEIADKLQKYIPDAVVTVAVKEIRGNSIFVLGKVNRPGPFIMNGRTDVMQALSMAGGAATFANVKDISVLRRQGGRQVAIPFNYAEVEGGDELQQNILLEPGDVVVVP